MTFNFFKNLTHTDCWRGNRQRGWVNMQQFDMWRSCGSFYDIGE